ncbi:hypothetical protein G5I_04286 [Acromyrmex echinatior]|uniref:Uncharacterized protein n=1 Tax=Acromyrmex echinatior TaxID=103372 RepID=F4WF79_ACREC|nr:hypothetical protein G5I_04286 [Acromyrmex echinatior]
MLGDWGRSGPFSCRRKQRVLPERSLYSKPLKERNGTIISRALAREESEGEFLHHPFAHTVPLHLLEPSPTPPIGKPPRLRPMHVLPVSIILTQPPIDRIQARRIAKYRRNVAEVVVDCVAYVSTPSARIATLRLPSAEDKSNGERQRNLTARGNDREMDDVDDGGGQASERVSESPTLSADKVIVGRNHIAGCKQRKKPLKNSREELPSWRRLPALTLYFIAATRRDARQEVTRRESDFNVTSQSRVMKVAPLTWGRSCPILAGGHACPRPAPRASSPHGGYTPTVQRQHTIDTYGTSSVGEGLPRLGTRKTSFVEYPTGTAQPPSNSFNPLRKNQ